MSNRLVAKIGVWVAVVSLALGLAFYWKSHTNSPSESKKNSPKKNGPSIVFVHIGEKLPSYLPVAISQARRFNKECPIFLVANENALESFVLFAKENKVNAVSCESLPLSEAHQAFLEKSKLDKGFRAGFCSHTFERFFYIEDLMKHHRLRHVFHLENDNMLYVDVHTLIPLFKSHYRKIAATFDNDKQCVPGFIYFSSAKALAHLTKFMVKEAMRGHNDMIAIARFRRVYRNKIGALPLVPPEYVNEEPLKSFSGHTANSGAFFCQHTEEFLSLFDAAAFGQYLGGIDPRNGPFGPGFINKECIFNPALFTLTWEKDSEGRKVPFATYQGRKWRLNNLHIHSKKLESFRS